MIGIYKIVNTSNNKVYIGQSRNISDRLHTHMLELRNNHHENAHLQASYNKYGADKFETSTIECTSIEELNIREKYWISYYRSYDPKYGYNRTYGGEGGDTYKLLSDEARQQLRTAASARLKGEGNPNYNKHCYTDGTTTKYISDDEISVYEANGWVRGVAEHTRRKARESSLGCKNGFYGKHHTEEMIQAKSKSQLGANNWNYGKQVYHKGNCQKYLDVSEVSAYEAEGWCPGLADVTKQKMGISLRARSEITNRSKIKYTYCDHTFYGMPKLAKYLKANGYPGISDTAIYHICEGKLVKKYPDLYHAIIRDTSESDFI